MHRQEYDRQGRVSADGGDRVAMRSYAGGLVELARCGKYARLLDYRIERSRDARRVGAENEMAQKAAAFGQVRNQAQPYLRARADLLAQVCALFQCGASPDSV